MFFSSLPGNPSPRDLAGLVVGATGRRQKAPSLGDGGEETGTAPRPSRAPPRGNLPEGREQGALGPWPC